MAIELELISVPEQQLNIFVILVFAWYLDRACALARMANGAVLRHGVEVRKRTEFLIFEVEPY